MLNIFKQKNTPFIEPEVVKCPSKGNKYTDEEKQVAVDLVLGGMSYRKIEQKTGIGRGTTAFAVEKHRAETSGNA